MGYFLGIDGGQSHTKALIADVRGKIVGVGHAGESNHTRAPGGRERLTNAINQSVSEALQQAGLLKKQTVAQFKFTSAYLSMTGEPEDKREIVKELLGADYLTVEHDTRGALAGAFAGGAGVIVMAGTGSVACGETADQRFVRVGGRGYLFADEGSAFAIARQAVSAAMRRADRVAGPEVSQDALQAAMLKHFKRDAIEQIIEDVYANEISRERLASFAAKVAALAERKEATAQNIIDGAAVDLAELAEATALRLNLDQPFNVSYSGGVFKSRRLLAGFTAHLRQCLPQATVVKPRFGPDCGALLLAYRQAGKRLTPAFLNRFALRFMG